VCELKTDEIVFHDGAAYERYMGRWSQLAGATFLDWLEPESGRRWLDVGCGNGAFTELLVERCDPAALHGIDPSTEQLSYARTRPALQTAQLRSGDAMALPYPDHTFDAAVMPLVIFFVPDPARGVAEMRRVVGPRGLVAAYAWDLQGGGFPYEAVVAPMRELGLHVPMPPSPEVSRIEALQDLWTEAGLEATRVRTITAQRTFSDFDEFWARALEAPSFGATLRDLAPDDRATLAGRVRARLEADATGRIACSAWANAVQGRVPR
jgi:ubiquinone/menaquinone biosynthesis C-methylase UbiE